MSWKIYNHRKIFTLNAITRLMAVGSILIFLWSCTPDSNKEIGGGPLTDTDLSNIQAYRSQGPYAPILPRCAQAANRRASCYLSTLPLIGMESKLDKETILNRLVVSHAWMGERFTQVLEIMPNDMIDLFKSVTMVIISSNIRPSYYWSLTGAIYLDPSYLWLSHAEKMTISQKQDYRSGYGNGLTYSFAWRYTKNEAYAYKQYSLSGTETREIHDIELSLKRLLYHELAHANDFFPVSIHAQLPLNRRILDAPRGAPISNALIGDSFPLQSMKLKDLATVFYRGTPPNAEQKSYKSYDLGVDFENDRATVLYSYHTQYEDFAMLTEMVMMNYHHQLEMEGAVMDEPKTVTDCNSYLVAKGWYNRLGDPKVKIAARYVTDRLFPQLDLTNFYSKVQTSTQMIAGRGWCTNLKKPTTIRAMSSAGKPSSETRMAVPYSDFLPPH